MRGPGAFWNFKDTFYLLCVEQKWGWEHGDQLQRSRRDSKVTVEVEKSSDSGCVLKAGPVGAVGHWT